jgi:hypothetical protein
MTAGKRRWIVRWGRIPATEASTVRKVFDSEIEAVRYYRKMWDLGVAWISIPFMERA